MNSTNYATKADLQSSMQKLEDRLGKKIEDVLNGAVASMAEVFRDGIQVVSERFDNAENRLRTVEQKIDGIQTIVIRIDNKFNDQQERLDYHETKLRLLQHKVA